MNIWDSSTWTKKQTRRFRITMLSIAIPILLIAIALIWWLVYWWTHFTVS